MANIKETALNYKAPETKNIAELTMIPVDVELTDKEFSKEVKAEDGSITQVPFTVTVFTLEEEEYRMPKTVLKQLKAQLEENTEIEFFKVKKEGSGMNTVYTVIILK
jgi:hypothetical protein